MKKEKVKTGRKKIFYNNYFMLRYIFKYVPSLIVLQVIIMIMAGAANVINDVYSIKYVLDSVQMKRSFSQVFSFLVFAVLFNLATLLLQTIYQQIIFPKKKQILFQKMHSELFQKAKSMELACYDNPKFYNDFVWATSEADTKALAVLENTGTFIKGLTAIVGIGAIIIHVNALGLLVVGVSLIISFLITLKVNKLEYEMALYQKPLQRERDYTSRVLYLADYAKEVRLSQIKKILIKNFQKANRKLLSVIKKYSFKMLKWQIINDNMANTFLLEGLYLAYLCYQTVVKNALTYGSFMGLYNGVWELKDNLEEMGDIISNFQKYSLYIERFMEFIHYEPNIVDTRNPVPIPEMPVSLRLENVSFTYEGTDKPTIHNINLTIHPGEKVALVGYNGAGKSTLIKLMMRLYDVSDGHIYLNDIDITKYSIKDFRNYFGVVFQDFQLFAASLAENVMMNTTTQEDEEKVKDALRHSGFEERLNTLEEGTATMLTREFLKSGVNLSGGESQKVAIARIFPRDCSMVILDEPSSALDPVSEYNVNQSMLAAAKDKNVVFISHRLSTTKIADRILMLEAGQIIEQGSHEELMQLDGKYAQMFNMQAEKYKEA